MGVTCRWCGQELVEVDNPLRPEVRHKRGQEAFCPGPPVEGQGPEVDVLRIHGFDGSETTVRVGPTGARWRIGTVQQRNDLRPWKTGQGPALTPFGLADAVLEWDVEDGGWLGAVISCRFCTGTGRVPEDHGNGLVEWLGCEDCSGSGKLHRPYAAGERLEGPTPEDDDGPAVVLGGPWSGCELNRFAYFLAGALATVMLPGHWVMPTEEIDEIIRRVMTSVGARAMTEDERPDRPEGTESSDDEG